ncbi:hypothetical protein IAR50_002849 [Cryptococcus sp. DSM 104548]
MPHASHAGQPNYGVTSVTQMPPTTPPANDATGPAETVSSESHILGPKDWSGRTGGGEVATPSTSSATSKPSALNEHPTTNSPPTRRPAEDHVIPQDFRFVRGETLENPADALRILYAAAEYDASQERSESTVSGEGAGQAGLWGRWVPVRDGLLTAEEARLLLACYKDHLNPCHPIVPPELFRPQHFSSLLSEPVLLAALVSTAARYLDLGHSFDEQEPQRSIVIQGKLMSWVSSKVGLLSMGDTSARTIGTVEALLILSEWPPIPSLITPSTPTTSPRRPPNPCTIYDDASWTLIGLAVRIAQELDLQNENTYMKSSEPRWVLHRRHNAWIHCLSADRQASVRLGRASLVQAKMSTCWWEALGAHSRDDPGPARPFPSSKLAWREIFGVAELTHLIGFLQELLYTTPSVTADLIKTHRFEITLHRLKPELDSLWRRQAEDLPSYDIFRREGEGERLTEDELREIRWRMEFDYVKLYANAIAMRAAQTRSRNRLQHPNDTVYHTNVMTAVEGPFILEAVDAALSLVKCGIVMGKKGVLRYCPCRVFTRLVFASVFLMKALSFGAIGQPDTEIIDLEYTLIDSLAASSADEHHISSYLAKLLSKVLESIPRRGGDGCLDSGAEDVGLLLNSHLGSEGSRSGPSIPASGLAHQHLDFGMGGPVHDGAGAGSGSGGSGWEDSMGMLFDLGYNPMSIVSDLEEMLAASDPGFFGSGGMGDM